MEVLHFHHHRLLLMKVEVRDHLMKVEVHDLLKKVEVHDLVVHCRLLGQHSQ
jgi:hypothetical protein